MVAAGWPTFDPKVARADELLVPVQVNGRVRARLTVASSISAEDLEVLAREAPQVRPYVKNKSISRVVVVPGKLVNIVAR